MGVFHVFYIVPMVPNRAKHHISRGIPLRFTFTAQKMKFSIKDFSTKCDVTFKQTDGESKPFSKH